MRRPRSSSFVNQIAVFVVVVALGCCVLPAVGVFPFGPEATITTQVTSVYVDVSSSGKNAVSHYMVGTRDGVFEVGNSLWLGIWNADEIYASIQEGKTYRLTTKGRKVVNSLMQEYPRVIRAQPAE